MGTFKSGVENVQLHHWSNAKPAKLRADFEEAQMPTRGRKPRKPETAQSFEPEGAEQLVQTPDPQTVQSDKSESDPPVTSVRQDGQSSTEASGANKPNRKINKAILAGNPPQPTRRSERIKNKSHATSINECQLTTSMITSISGPPQGAPFSNAGNSNATKPWSASKHEIEELNRSISRAAG